MDLRPWPRSCLSPSAAAGGVVPAPAGYAQASVMCTRHEVLLIADRVMCGSGRCGTWCALEHDRVTPDIIAVAKGLAGGYIPLAATIFKRELGDAIVQAHGAVLTGHTYRTHRRLCLGLAVQRIIDRDALLARVQPRGESRADNVAEAALAALRRSEMCAAADIHRRQSRP